MKKKRRKIGTKKKEKKNVKILKQTQKSNRNKTVRNEIREIIYLTVFPQKNFFFFPKKEKS